MTQRSLQGSKLMGLNSKRLGETIPSLQTSSRPRDIICKGRQGGRAATTLALPPADGHLEGHGCHRAMEPISDMGHVAKSWMIWIDMVGKNSLPDLARSCQMRQECLNCIELSDLV